MLENNYVNFGGKNIFLFYFIIFFYKRKNFETFSHLKMYLQYTKIQKQFKSVLAGFKQGAFLYSYTVFNVCVCLLTYHVLFYLTLYKVEKKYPLIIF